MPELIIEPNEKKRKSSYDRWNELYEVENERMKQDLERNVDPELSSATKKIISIVAQMMNLSYTDAKMFLNDWMRNHGIKDLTKATKPGWKSITALTATTTLKVGSAFATAVVPIGGLTGGAAGGANLVAGLSGAGGECGSSVTQMMEKTESSKQTALNFGLESSKGTASELREGVGVFGERLKRHQQEVESEQQRKADTTRAVLQ